MREEELGSHKMKRRRGQMDRMEKRCERGGMRGM